MLDSLKSLVLNYSYEPLQFCSAKHAIVMVLTGRAEGIECDGYVVRSPSTHFKLPAVIRILKMVRRNRKNRVAFSKKNILRRDNYTCQYCGDSDSTLTIDHIFPKSRGGIAEWRNVVVACKPCNLRKGNRTLAEADMKLICPPTQPDFQYMQFHVPPGPQSHVEIWQKYLPAGVFAGSILN
ncbi:MAG: HNH endonuclease [Nitrospinae bacterium CG11_big_fil_rev_8_21_14_0_20_56_8]|nr:MAG: HNH endonuclease [Nitrospinae bacterium CG11_big_fil_rev_8_21_14_0_20_56_8]